MGQCSVDQFIVCNNSYSNNPLRKEEKTRPFLNGCEKKSDFRPLRIFNIFEKKKKKKKRYTVFLNKTSEVLLSRSDFV